VSSTSLNQFPSGTKRLVTTGVPDFDHHTRDTILWNPKDHYRIHRCIIYMCIYIHNIKCYVCQKTQILSNTLGYRRARSVVLSSHRCIAFSAGSNVLKNLMTLFVLLITHPRLCRELSAPSHPETWLQRHFLEGTDFILRR